MPANRSSRTINLLDRHFFAEAVLMEEVRTYHYTVKHCCTSTQKCLLYTALEQSVDLLHRDSLLLREQLDRPPKSRKPRVRSY